MYGFHSDHQSDPESNNNLYRTENKLRFTCVSESSEYEATVNSLHIIK